MIIITPFIGFSLAVISFLTGICCMYLAFTEFAFDEDRKWGMVVCSVLIFLVGVLSISIVVGWIP